MLPEIIKALQEVSEDINTVFSLCVASKLDKNGENPSIKALDDLGIDYRPNGKLNIGLGKPYYNF